MMHLLHLTVAGISLLMLSSSQVGVLPERPVTVCQVLQTPNKYRGRIIEVRGEYDGGDLRGSCPPLRTNGYTWTSAIQLEFPQNLSVKMKLPQNLISAEEDPAQWTFDLNAYEDTLKRVESLQRVAGPGTVVRATVAGRLDVPDSLMVKTEKGQVPNGFGHLNIYPARLVLVRITDIRSEKI